MDKVLFSKNSDDWATPKDFYDKLNLEFNFTFDPCPLNADFDGLNIDWSGNVYINPPYSNIKGFLEKARGELNKNNCNLCVFLIPSRTDTKWFHEYIYIRDNVELRFIKGRLKFGNSKNSAPFPSMVVIMRSKL
jgi:phage N-6-adenine-methyltransferase